MKTTPLPPYIKKIMLEIHKFIGVNRFIIYGGAPLDLLLNSKAKIHDLDIAIKGITPAKILSCQQHLKKNGFELVAPNREYFIYINKKVILIYAQNNEYLLDIGFLHEPELVGHFDIETLYCRYPELDYVDKFHALDAVRNKTITNVRGLDMENPYMLISRFVYLCAKYGISLMGSISNRKTLARLADLIRNWKNSEEFHITLAPISCISSIFKSILKVKDKSEFLKELLESMILETVFPELQQALYKTDINNKKICNKLAKIKTKYQLISFFRKNLDPEDKIGYDEKIKKLAIRTWDKQDVDSA